MKVSLVVPVQDEEESIDVLLDSIGAQSRPPAEVVVVDAASMDGTRERLMARRLPPPTLLRVIRGQRIHPGVARNLGVAAAYHEWLALTDAGIQLDTGWLEALMEGLGTPPADVVFGSYEPVCDTFFRRSAALAYVPGPGRGGIRGPSVTSVLMARHVFESVGGFPPHRAAEDLLFMEKILHSGRRVRYAPGAVARWSIPPDTLTTFRRFRLYSYHNLVAGRGGQWHWGLGRLYVGAVGLAGLAYALGLGAMTAALIPGFYLARALRAAIAKRGTLPFNTANPACLLVAAVVIVVVDVATLLGTIDWLIQGQPRRP